MSNLVTIQVRLNEKEIKLWGAAKALAKKTVEDEIGTVLPQNEVDDHFTLMEVVSAYLIQSATEEHDALLEEVWG